MEALRRAITQGNEEEAMSMVLSGLLKLEGADLDELDENNNHVLNLVVLAEDLSEAQRLRLAQALMDAGAHPTSSVMPGVFSCLDFAAQRGLLSLVQLFLQAGCSPLALGGRDNPSFCAAVAHPTCFQLMLDRALALASPAKPRAAILSLGLLAAVTSGALASARMLLDSYGADPSAPAGNAISPGPICQYSPLTLSVAISDSDTQYQMAKMLLQHGADPRKLGPVNPPNSPLTEAIGTGAVGTVRAILEQGVSPSEADDESISGLTRAAAGDSPEMVKLLLRFGAEINGNNLHKFGSPLFQAVVSGPKCVPVLLAANPDLEVRNQAGRTVLHVAVDMNDQEVLWQLLEAGANPNALDADGRTPLDSACRGMHFVCVILLLEYGANPSMTNRKASDSLDVVTWLSSAETEAYRDMLQTPSSRLLECLGLMSSALEHGFLWPRWSKSTHRLFPKNVRDAIFTLLCLHRRRDCIIHTLPKWLIPMIIEFVATRSKKNEWRWEDLNSWKYEPRFMELMIQRNCESFLPEGIVAAIESGQCTKTVSSNVFLPQPFYSCEDCRMCPRGNANLGLCGSCAEKCHRSKGHKVFFNSCQPAFCDCSGSAMCDLVGRLELFQSEEARNEVDDEDSEYGWLVCIQQFPPEWEGQRMLGATPGELMRVKREDIRNGVANADMRGLKGAFPLSSEYVRWLAEFVVAGVDHQATEEGELSFKQGDFILVVKPLEGKAAEGKTDPWMGLLCTNKGSIEGWFSAPMTELVTRFSVERVQKKIRGAQLYSDFCDLVLQKKYVDAAEIGPIMCDTWMEAAPPGPISYFSANGAFISCCRDLMQLYRTMGEYELAFQCAHASLVGLKKMVPARPPGDIMVALVDCLENGARAGGHHDALVEILAELERLRPPEHQALHLLACIARLELSVSSGDVEQAKEVAREFVDLARKYELPLDHHIWLQAAPWVTMAGCIGATPDVRERLCHNNLISFLADFQKSKSTFGNDFLYNFELYVGALINRSAGVSERSLRLWADRLVWFAKTLHRVAISEGTLALLQHRKCQVRVQRLFSLIVESLFQIHHFAETQTTVLLALEILSLAPHDLPMSPVFLSKPSTEKRFLMRVFRVDSLSAAHSGPVAPIIERELMRSEDEENPDLVPLPNLGLPDVPHLVVLLDGSGNMEGTSHFTVSHGYLKVCRPTEQMLEVLRVRPIALLTNPSAALVPKVAATNQTSAGAASSLRGSSSSAPQRGIVPRWVWGAAAVAGLAGVVGAAVYIWGTAGKDNSPSE